jgi:hypothetical protein
MDQEHIRLSLLSHDHGLTRTHGNRLDKIAGLFLKNGQENFQKSGILSAGRRREDDGLFLRPDGENSYNKETRGDSP